MSIALVVAQRSYLLKAFVLIYRADALFPVRHRTGI